MDDYYLRKKKERLDEAGILWKRMQQGGVTPETVLVLEFVHFGSARPGVDALAAQLGENYRMEVLPADQAGYWLARGTTRPYGVSLDGTGLLDWVAFMADVAQSHGCVFSTWSAEAPVLKVQFRSEDIEV